MELPCPHCGGTKTLTERKASEIKPVIPEDFQYDFEKGKSETANVYSSSAGPKSISKQETDFHLTPISLNVPFPLESIFPSIHEPIALDAASLKVYFQLALEFQIVLDEAANYREGVHRWQLLLPDRLQQYGLTEDAWERISRVGDSDDVIQNYLNKLIKRVFD
ncbi:MAG: hypothetical protein ACFFE8_14920 [Candidatus Heimdallarchaeota archaeon]